MHCRSESEKEDPNADTSSKPIFNSGLQVRQDDKHKPNGTKPHWRMIGTGFKYTGRRRRLDNGERDTGGHNEGGASNQDQGRQSQGDR